jgi:cysteinyl-tRNA synthetase
MSDQLVVLGTRLAAAPKDEKSCMEPVIDNILVLRQKFRESGQWAEADAVREILERSHVKVEDTPEGTRWNLTS